MDRSYNQWDAVKVLRKQTYRSRDIRVDCKVGERQKSSSFYFFDFHTSSDPVFYAESEYV